MMGVSEYYLIDPTGEYLEPRLRAWRLHGDEYVEVISRPMVSEVLGLEFRVVEGVLRLADPSRLSRLRSPCCAPATPGLETRQTLIRRTSASLSETPETIRPADRNRLTTALRAHVGAIAGDLRAMMRTPGPERDRARKLHADERVGDGSCGSDRWHADAAQDSHDIPLKQPPSRRGGDGMRRKIISIVLIASLWAAVTPPAQAITVCFDYVWFRVTGKDVNRIGPGGLKAELRKRGYKPFPFSNAARQPNASRFLRPGYVIFLGDAHVGYVVKGGLIDHFLQVFGKSGTRYAPDALPPNAEGTKGGLYRGATLDSFVHCGFSKNPQPVEVWRR